MTQMFNDKDEVMAITVIQAEPNTICGEDGRNRWLRSSSAGLRRHQDKKVNSPMRWPHYASGVELCRHLREVRVENASETNPRQADRRRKPAEVAKVDVTGISKGQRLRRRHQQ